MTTEARPFDRAALEALYVRLERPLYNAAFRWTWEPEEARELVQEAFVRLWAKRDEVRPETVEPLVWRITLNLCRKRRRWHRLRTFFGIDRDRPDERPGADALLLGVERAREVRAAVEALPDAEREALLLTHFSGLSYRDAAAILGVAEGTVGSRRNAAVRRLRGVLEVHDA
ncbi:MAG: sigma-70 family RNA polymerase sigma factor [Alphaproteobacteria bacterium]|nr:sigma-70 family RNA polymerase sigma factor [Alphaproteobacteria bacterium]MCB9697727.1 sigma-70 family RNA polymerase sigma factor [Alphaproteobacteria bacterium]